MRSSRERGSSTNRGGGRDEVNGDGWSATLGSSGSGGVLKKKSKFVAPECNCGAFAILFMSSTLGNPNRLFYGCPYFKTPAPHCKFFRWLDEYVVSNDQEVSKPALDGCWKQNEGKQIGSTEFDVKVRQLEKRVAELEMQLKETKNTKSGSGFNSTWWMFFAFVFGIVFGHLI
ncbi:hypothetical protein PIB30_096064 [Stylosanthes scabra]|uniref:GRF-type domain-containing protein n=1 Tax=Stylosanthes scabra TaxID=79078 RepID=A0ABU6UVF7_9FABA|nr:hypothetical protein [Stylosanthes scabra]